MDQNFFNKIRILDGGMGQELLARGMEPNGTLWSANALLQEKYHQLLLDTHLDFIKAGAEVIVTTTFASRQIRLKENNCENDSRNLHYVRIVGDEVKKYIISEKFKNKYGMWLIGYDGQIKSYSSDISLLKEIYNIIDKMPMRKKEILEQKKKCD